MNRIIFTIFATFCLLSSFTLAAQEGDRKGFDWEDFQAKRNAFITKELNLSPQEAKAFLPLSNEFQKKLFELGKDCRKDSRTLYQKENPTDSEYLRVVDDCINTKLREAQLEKEYFDQFRKILSPKQLFLYQGAEGKFAREYMKDGKGRGKEEKK